MTLTQILSKLKSLVYSKTETDTLLGNKAASSHTHSDYIPKDGTTSITGTGFFKSTSDSQLQIGSGTSTTTGGCFVAYGSEYSNSELAGSFRLRARKTRNYDLLGKDDGTLTWGTKNVAMAEDVIPRSGGNVITATKLAKVNNDGDLDICGGTGYTQGGYISVRGNNSSSGASTVLIGCGSTTNSICLYPDGRALCAMNFQPNSNNTYDLGTSSKKWKTINGVDPGALSLPKMSGIVDIKGLFNSNFQWAATADGWVAIHITDYQGSVSCVTLRTNDLGLTYGTEDSNNYASSGLHPHRLCLPVKKGETVTAFMRSTTGTYTNKKPTSVWFIPCAGNI